jgi:hypothetical protein
MIRDAIREIIESRLAEIKEGRIEATLDELELLFHNGELE